MMWKKYCREVKATDDFLHLALFSLCAFLLTVFVLRVLLSSYVYFFILCVYVVPYMYLLYLMCICCTMCVLLFLLNTKYNYQSKHNKNYCIMFYNMFYNYM